MQVNMELEFLAVILGASMIFLSFAVMFGGAAIVGRLAKKEK